MYPTANTNFSAIFSQAVGVNFSNEFSFVVDITNSDYFSFVVSDGSNSTRATSSETINLNQWYHVAAVYDGANAKLYVNGVQKASVSFSGNLNLIDSPVLVGQWSSPATNNRFQGNIDEARIWNTALSETQIRESMCKKVTSSHTEFANLLAYFDFDEGSGDYIGNLGSAGGGTLNNSPTWETSAAPIGDESTYSYGSGNSTAVTETHADGSSLKIDGFTGTPDGAHVYLVNEAPNSTTESLSGALDATRYYGTFAVGGTSPNYSVTYNYTGNTNITGGTEAQAVLTSRADNSTSSWSKETNNLSLNASTNEISLCGVSGNKEFAAGFDTKIQERPGSGYALDFDGTNDYVNVPDDPSLDLTSNWTLEAWVKIDVTGSQYGFIEKYDWDIGAGGGGYILRMTNSNEVYSATLDGTNISGLSSTTSLGANKWYHIASTYDQSSATLKIYINGVLDASSSSISVVPTPGSLDLRLGARGDDVNRRLNGKMDEVRIWNATLTETQIRERICKKITGEDPLFCNLVGYYRFDENTGTTLYDYAKNNDGTFVGSPSYVLSGAALGDESTYSYGSGNSTTVTETHADGSSLKIDGFTGAPDGAHVYLVNESPNSTTESLSGALDATRYYGTFVVGGTSPTHTVTYDYTGNTNISGGTEAQTVLATRVDNSGTSWTKTSTNFNLNEAADEITICEVSTDQEYIGGFDTELQERPGSGYALTFSSSSSQNIQVAHNAKLNATTEVSIMGWIKPTVSGVTKTIITKRQNSIGQETNYGMDYHNGELRFFTNSGSGFNIYTTSSGDVTLNQWNHIAGTFNNGTVNIYVNGVLQSGSGTLPSSLSTNSRGLIIGGNENTQYFDGQIDEVSIWNTALTEAQIRERMCKKVASEDALFCNLMAYYRFDENTGTTLYDYAGGNNGTLTNGPTYTLSGAAIGDESTYLYGSGNSTTITETHSDGSSFKVDGFTGTPDGAHVYLVNEAPNSTTESLSGALDETRYYGTFVVGGTSPTHTVTYDYTGNTNISGGTEAQSVLATRADNSGTSWTKLTNNYDLNTTTDVITQCNVTDNQEYIGGFDAEMTERPGSGYALDFDGTNDYVSASNPNISPPLSMELWVNLNSSNTNGQLLLQFGGGGIYIGRFTQGRALVFFDGSSSNNSSADESTIDLLDNQWHHIVATTDGSITRLYVDGVLNISHNETAVTGSSPLYIGSNSGSSFFTEGSIDEVKIWNVALTEAQIRESMCKKITSEDALFCNLLAYYRFDENTGTTLYDYAGGNNGTLTNSPTYSLSGAAIGDESTFSYGSGNSIAVTETHADGSSLKIDGFTGTPDGAHVYLVNETPNSNARTGFSGNLDETRYYGVFVAGGTSSTYNITYDYTGNTNITGGTEAEARLGARNDNAESIWNVLTSNADLDQAANTITKSCFAETQKEFIAGFTNTEEFAIEPGSGYALSFDGGNDFVSVPHSSDLNLSEFSMMVWVKTASSLGWDNIFVKGSYGYGVGIDHSNGSRIRFWNQSGGSSTPSSTTGVTQNEWTHVAVTSDGTTVKFYINGKLDATSSLAAINNNSDILTIGRQGTGCSCNYFHGEMDEFSIWNKALTISEIQNWMNRKITSDHPEYCNLKAYYMFDENTGTTLKDFGGNTNGTISGATFQMSAAPTGGDDAIKVASANSATTLNLAANGGDDLTVNVTSGSADLLQVVRVDGSPNNKTNPGGIDNMSAYNYFMVKGFGTSSFVYEIVYNYDGHPGITDESELYICSRPDNASNWTLTAATRDESANTLTLTGQTGTEFILGSGVPGNALPVEFTAFEVYEENGFPTLFWQTASEINSDFFEIQTSKDAKNWDAIGQVNAGGNSSTTLNYNFVDSLSFIQDFLYYRLRQVDFDGSYVYSNVAKYAQDNQAEEDNIKVYPNPATELVTVEFPDMRRKAMILRNIHGRPVQHFESDYRKVATLDVSNLGNGIYFLQVQYDNHTETISISIYR